MGGGFARRLAKRFGGRLRDGNGGAAEGAATAKPLHGGLDANAYADAIREPVADIEPEPVIVDHVHTVTIRLDDTAKLAAHVLVRHSHVVTDSAGERHAHTAKAYPVTSGDFAIGSGILS